MTPAGERLSGRGLYVCGDAPCVQTARLVLEYFIQARKKGVYIVMRKNSVKNRKINDEVRRVLAQIISGGIKDPRISPMTSVLAVEVAPDLKTCKVWVSVYGDDRKKQETMAGLNSASGFIRGELARRVNLRNTPQLRFILDDSIAYGVEMSRRIDEVRAADLRAEEMRGDESEEMDGEYGRDPAGNEQEDA